MKRIQLFELEDLRWFPNWIRTSMTRMITVIHGWLRTPHHVAEILADVLERSGRRRVVDLCSGDGGPMPEVLTKLRDDHELNDIEMVLTDLYPNRDAAERIDRRNDSGMRYQLAPVDVGDEIPHSGECVRTMICSFHHMPPPKALGILRSAMSAGDPLLIYEISDNSAPPKYLWWIGLPLNFLFGLVVAGFARPMKWSHFVFSFLIPVIPACFAWDGAVSNARTYTLSDIDSLLSQLGQNDHYRWTTGIVKAKPANHLYLVGMPLF